MIFVTLTRRLGAPIRLNPAAVAYVTACDAGHVLHLIGGEILMVTDWAAAGVDADPVLDPPPKRERRKRGGEP